MSKFKYNNNRYVRDNKNAINTILHGLPIEAKRTLEHCPSLNHGLTVGAFVERVRPGTEMYELRRVTVPCQRKPYPDLPLRSREAFDELNTALAQDQRLFERLVSLMLISSLY